MITQAWDRLKITTLSKAIAMAPNVTCCTIGPKCLPLDEEEPDTDSEQPNLGNAVTSTPLKRRKPRVAAADDSFEVSEIQEETEPDNLITEDMNSLELAVKRECLRRLEIQITRLSEVSIGLQ